MSELKLVVFDVDGTLVDSQGDIVAAMGAAFASVGAPAPTRADVLSIVGLSLEIAIPRLAPQCSAAEHTHMVATYRDSYASLRAKSVISETSPLYPGARSAIEALHARPHTLLGVATGKSRRGLDVLMEGHDLGHFFVTRQVCDFHPSKPHPAMLQAALAEAGVGPEQAIMIGDTSFDMEMARSAGVAAIGVSWGYHAVESLALADRVIHDFAELLPAIDQIWNVAYE
ncbi:phosphoglycolate phosphatase [Poseidonocella pacifica]|uniref:Phosphoglycolate phosphatase n=1 Tax=Poseidonocella pacifica TaxID=871651 RepID=A0A1I0XIE2_9RHOB|nr:HAD-IA family hydrolase [Poseidonocella pacifica]SFB00447.1 phosphoglycolate phosphatase [Poseidonocella pacifica]